MTQRGWEIPKGRFTPICRCHQILCVWEMYTLQLSLFSVTKSEHAHLKSWADELQSAAEREREMTCCTVIPWMKWSDKVRFSVWFTALQMSPKLAFQNPWREGTLQVQNTIVKNWQCQDLLTCVQTYNITEQRESSFWGGCYLSSSCKTPFFFSLHELKFPQIFSNFYGPWYAPITPFSPWVILWNAISLLNIVGLFRYCTWPLFNLFY